MASKNPKQRTLTNRKWKLKTKYGMTVEEYDEMLVEQDFRCKICKSKEKLYIDHNHETDKVRGLLCNGCNLVLGWSKENIIVLLNTVEYLEDERDG
jgi:hypothetical protein